MLAGAVTAERPAKLFELHPVPERYFIDKIMDLTGWHSPAMRLGC
jgi:hypothetical protein